MMTFEKFNEACDFVMEKCNVDNDTALEVVGGFMDIFNLTPSENPKEFFNAHAFELELLGFSAEDFGN